MIHEVFHSLDPHDGWIFGALGDKDRACTAWRHDIDRNWPFACSNIAGRKLQAA